MLRLCSKSSRPYQGRPVRYAVRILTASDTATYRVIGQESAEVILGAAGETSRTRVRRTHLIEGLNTEQGRKGASMRSHDMKNPCTWGTSLNRPTQIVNIHYSRQGGTR